MMPHRKRPAILLAAKVDLHGEAFALVEVRYPVQATRWVRSSLMRVSREATVAFAPRMAWVPSGVG